MTKAELLVRLRHLRDEIQRANERADACKREYETLVEKYQPELDRLSEKASSLAEEFKSLYRQSQAAFGEGDGELAKELSVKGHEIQDECEAQNARANRLREMLREARSQMMQEFSAIKRASEDIKNTQCLLSECRSTIVKGFRYCEYLSDHVVETCLDSLPQIIFASIGAIQFASGIRGDQERVQIGSTVRNLRSKDPVVITLFPHPHFPGRSDEEISTTYKMTLMHEIGHVVFERMMTDTQRFMWGRIFEERFRDKHFITEGARESRGEDFCECFVIFVLDEKRLLRFDEQRYMFMKDIYNSLLD